MKKILLAIFGAALLMVGCTKEIETAVADVNSRLDALEAQVNANKAAIQALQAAKFVESVTEMPDHAGWTIVLSDRNELAIYNGKDGAAGTAGKDGDAFFKSVVIEGDFVIFTLTDNSVITVPLKIVFALEIDGELGLKAGEIVDVPYVLTGAIESTAVYASASDGYTASVDAAAKVIRIGAPAVFKAGRILVVADRGDGRFSAKEIVIGKGKATIETVGAAAAPFWGGSVTLKAVSNTHVTLTTDADWITLTETKAEFNYTAAIGPTPSCLDRTAYVYVKDDAGVVLKKIAVGQDGIAGESGSGQFFLNNQVMYSSWDAAKTALATATADGQNIATDGSVTVYVSQDADVDRIELPANPAITSFKVTCRPYGNVDPAKTFVSAVTVPAGIPTVVENITIRPKNKEIIANINNGTNGTALLIMPGEVNLTVNNVIFDNSNETWRDQEPTVVYANGTGLAGKATFTGCTFTPGVQRFGQVWGATEYEFDGCTFVNDISAYNLRIYDSVKLTIKNSLVDCLGDFVNVRTENNVVSPAVAEGKTVEDTNTYSDRVVNVYTGSQAAVPAKKELGGIVTRDGIAYPTVTAALINAPSGSVIEIGEGEIDDNIKIPNGKAITIKAAAAADRDAVIINGNIEIAGSLTMKNVTLKTKEGVTNNELAVNISGDNYVWGHIYLARVENGASNVTFDNVHFVATAASETIMNTASMLWISQAKNVNVLNCIFDAAANACYCPNQTHAAEVVFKGNVFNGLGKKEWVLRIMDTTKAIVAENEFNVAQQAIQIYSDFAGSLVIGDGAVDNNVYAPSVQIAVYSAKSMAEYQAAGTLVKPLNIQFNAPTTAAPKLAYSIEEVWAHIDDAAWASTFDIANVRNMAMNEKAMYLPSTSGHIYTLSLENGKVGKDQTIEDTQGHWPGLCGAYSLPDGTILFGTMAMNDAKRFKVYTYDGTNLVNIVDMPGESQYRLGDLITATGTKDDITIYAVDYKTGSADNGRYLVFNYKGGPALTAPTSIVTVKGMLSYKNEGFNANMAEMIPFAPGKYYAQYEGGKDDYIITDGAEFATAKALTLGDLAADVNVRMTRGAKFFTVGENKYMALVEFMSYNGGNGVGGRVHVYYLPSGNPEQDLPGAHAVATYELPSTTGSGNACASLCVLQVKGETYIGVMLRAAGAALLKFNVEDID